jgi:hypothetical protein
LLSAIANLVATALAAPQENQLITRLIVVTFGSCHSVPLIQFV